MTGVSGRLSSLRRDCLIRDRHRCVITRRFDLREALIRDDRDDINAKDDDGNWLRDEIEDPEFLEVAHILPHSLLSSKDGNSQLVCSEYTCSHPIISTDQLLERPKNNRTCNSQHVPSLCDNFDRGI